jgi:tetratricopeptide (TPR) repeat protein
MRFSIVLLGLLICSGKLLPQQYLVRADSLEQALVFTEDVAEQLQINLDLADIYFGPDPEKSLNYSERALELAAFIQMEKQEAIAYYHKGMALFELFHKPEAIDAFLLAKEIFTKLEEKAWIADVCYKLGSVYKSKLNFEKALSEYHEGLAIEQEMGNENKIANFLNHIGGVYYDQSDFDNAFKYYKRSMAVWEKLGDSRGVAIQYNNFGEIFRFKGEFDRALAYYRKAISHNKVTPDYRFLAINYNNMGNVFLSLEQNDSAGHYLKKSLKMAQLKNDPKLVSMANNSLGLLMMENKQYELANMHFQKAFELAEVNQLKDVSKNAAYGLSLVYANKKDYKNALYYHKKYKVLNDSIINIGNSGKITEIELKLKFENEKKLKEIQQQRTRFLYILIALGLFGIIVILVMLYGRLKINIRHSKSRAINLYLENKHLEEDIDFKNRELATNVMYLLKKNELINYISDKLLKAKVQFKSHNQPIIEEILLDLQSNINSEIWVEFEKRFRAVHKGFYDKLNKKFPKLTDADKKLCALLRLNLSTKEIAAISHQNPNSVEVARTRLRKKLDLSNKDVGLVSFLSNL